MFAVIIHKIESGSCFIPRVVGGFSSEEEAHEWAGENCPADHLFAILEVEAVR